MTREIIDLIISNAKVGYPNATSSELYDIIRTSLGASFDDFCESANSNRIHDIRKCFEKYNTLPENDRLCLWLNNFMWENCDVFVNVETDYIKHINKLTEYAVDTLARQFKICKNDETKLSNYLNGIDDLSIEWSCVELDALSNEEVLPFLNEVVNNALGRTIPKTLEKEINSNSYTELCASIKSEFAMLYAILNTTNYDGDMGVIIYSCSTPLAMEKMGFSKSECETIARLKIGESCMSEDYGNGVVVVRMA